MAKAARARFGEAGLRELAIESEAVAEGSTDRVMSGKHYNRAVRLHKVTYEALMRLLVQVFETFVTSETSAVTVEFVRRTRAGGIFKNSKLLFKLQFFSALN